MVVPFVEVCVTRSTVRKSALRRSSGDGVIAARTTRVIARPVRPGRESSVWRSRGHPRSPDERASAGAVRSTHDPTAGPDDERPAAGSPIPRVLVDLFVAVVVAVLSVADVGVGVRRATPGERPVDAARLRARDRRLGSLLLAAAPRSSCSRSSPPPSHVLPARVRRVLVGARPAGAVRGRRPRRAPPAGVVGDQSIVVVLLVAAASACSIAATASTTCTAVSMAAFLVAAIAAGVIIRNRERIFVDTERRAAAGRSRPPGGSRTRRHPASGAASPARCTTSSPTA